MGKSEIWRILLNLMNRVFSDTTETTDSVLTAPNLMFCLEKNGNRTTKKLHTEHINGKERTEERK
jgi:hypothetical protein